MKEGAVYWQAIYFSYGMTAQYKYFNSEAEALEWWSTTGQDPHTAATVLEQIKVVRKNP